MPWTSHRNTDWCPHTDMIVDGSDINYLQLYQAIRIQFYTKCVGVKDYQWKSGIF